MLIDRRDQACTSCPPLLVNDPYDLELLARVRPSNWVNPRPQHRYNLIVIGGGTTGLAAARSAAKLGAKVALIECALLGGHSQNFGMTPLDVLRSTARFRLESQRLAASAIGVPPGEGRFDLSAITSAARRVRATSGWNCSAQSLTASGVDVYFGRAKFTGPESVRVGESELQFARAAVCTGSHHRLPQIAGLSEVGFVTDESVYCLTGLPARLAVLGAGPTGTALAQIFARLGSRVHLIDERTQILPDEPPEAASLVLESLRNDGVEPVLGAKVIKAESRSGAKVLQVSGQVGDRERLVDEVLVVPDRSPNLEELGLSIMGVDYGGRSGIEVDDCLRSTNPRIFAAGSACSRYRSPQAAGAMAEALVRNALFPHPMGLGSSRTSKLIAPRCTDTDPILAHVGLTRREALEQDVDCDSASIEFEEVESLGDRERRKGLASILYVRRSERILGATLVSHDAGDLIAAFAMLIRARKGMKALDELMSCGGRRTARLQGLRSARPATKAADRLRSLLTSYFAWTR